MVYKIYLMPVKSEDIKVYDKLPTNRGFTYRDKEFGKKEDALAWIADNMTVYVAVGND
jgi:hypothetical protein